MKRIVLLIIIGILIMPVHYLNVDILLADPGVNYYVANSGSDSNDGLSPGAPWRTIGKVNSALSGGEIGQGDNIYFNRGDSWSGTSIALRTGGTSSNYMVFGAYGSGARPYLSNSAAAMFEEHSSLVGGGYIRFESLEISDCGSKLGIRIYPSNGWIYGISVYDCVFNNNYYGVRLTRVNGYSIENSYFSNPGMSSILIGGSSTNHVTNGRIWNCTISGGPRDGISLHYHTGVGEVLGYLGQKHWIKNCTITGTAEAGIDLATGATPGGAGVVIEDCEITTSGPGIAGGHYAERITYDNNYIHNIGRIMYWTHDSQCVFRNNIIYDWSYDGITVYAQSGEMTEDIAIYNNNFISTGTSEHFAFGNQGGDVETLHYKNNIFSSTQPSTPGMYVGSNVITFDSLHSDWTNNMWWRTNTGNLWYDGGSSLTFAQWQARSDTSGELWDNPEIVSIPNDFTLSDTSPCIDAGDWLTTANGGGSGTVITVHEADYFMDGYDIQGYSGDNIFVGDDTDLEITDVNYASNQITVDRSITWSDGDDISLSGYSGSKVDIGAREFVPSGPDTTPPQISNVILTESNPLDTDPSFGWVNITCDVTDNSAVDEVFLNITNPDGSYNNVSMISGALNSYYYISNTMCSAYGNYSYLIWADDINGNPSTSTFYDFSMPPNWDINNDGQCNVLDFTLSTNHYWETGQNGWIREDVDNSGIVNVLDFVLLQGHFDETWWT